MWHQNHKQLAYLLQITILAALNYLFKLLRYERNGLENAVGWTTDGNNSMKT
jgi:hypothetical protein